MRIRPADGPADWQRHHAAAASSRGCERGGTRAGRGARGGSGWVGSAGDDRFDVRNGQDPDGRASDGQQVLGWVGQAQRATVFATYASLPVLVEAHGAGLGPWALVVVDEAHRTSGPWGRPWAAIHDDASVPADRRLYLTATPRVAEPWQAKADESTGVPSLVASMDDERVFGPVVYRLTLAEAIDRGLLARYQIVVLAATTPAINRAATRCGERARPGAAASRCPLTSDLDRLSGEFDRSTAWLPGLRGASNSMAARFRCWPCWADG